MTMNAGAMQSWGKGRKTVAFGTKIDILVPPRQSKRTKLCKVSVTVAGTAHTLTVLMPLASTVLTADAAAGQAVINVAADPGDYTNKSTADNPIAAGDYLVIQKPDGTYLMDTVASVASLAITMTTVLPTLGLKSGAKVWFMGVAADVSPQTAEAHPVFTLPASATTSLEATQGSLAETPGMGEPMILQENNATATATVEHASGVYGP